MAVAALRDAPVGPGACSQRGVPVHAGELLQHASLHQHDLRHPAAPHRWGEGAAGRLGDRRERSGLDDDGARRCWCDGAAAEQQHEHV